MQRWEYLFVWNDGSIEPASHRLQPMYQYLRDSLPHLSPKDLKISNQYIFCIQISTVDVMCLLGIDGWEVAGVGYWGRNIQYVLKRPTG
jgi:hypothetical protein